jgi:hypothetical protein
MATLKSLAAACLLALQVGSFAYQRWQPTKYFCWAPHDYHNVYSLRVQVHGRELGEREIERRYRIDSLRGFFKDDVLAERVVRHLFPTDPPEPSSVFLGHYHPGPVLNVLDTIRQREASLPESERAAIVMHYSMNGRPPEQWRFPPEP